MTSVTAHRLEELVREAEVLSTIKSSVPHAWKILELEIGRTRAAVVRSVDHHSLQPSTSEPALPITSSTAAATATTTAAVAVAAAAAAATASTPTASSPPPTQRQTVRKRVKLRVPAEQYPDYNFVGRLLGPRGATLKRLERDTGCRIMIRGKGSIRKDKEVEVRGKPGWEHVFHEPLHVVIEVVDAADDVGAARILARAKELVEMLLIPVPEERDSLKRAQLRDLAILNGTHRSVSDLLGASVAQSPIPTTSHVRAPTPTMPSPPPPTRARSTAHAQQHGKTNPKNLYNNSNSDNYAPTFDAPVSFTRHSSYPSSNNIRSISSSPPPPVSASPHAYQSSTPFSSNQRDSYNLPELDQLRIPSLEFDHLSETNLTAHGFPMPSPSPTIVDPEIYPYPPTPGLLNVDHQSQLNAFGSPMWTPNRSVSTGALNNTSSSALPPRSPHAIADGNGANSSTSFLLGRALGDAPRQQAAAADVHAATEAQAVATNAQAQFIRSNSKRGSELSFEQSFAAHQISDNESGEFGGSSVYARLEDDGHSHSLLANLFPSNSGALSHVTQPSSLPMHSSATNHETS